MVPTSHEYAVLQLSLNCLRIPGEHGIKHPSISESFRYVPPKKWTPSQPLPKQGNGYVDKFGNIWTKGPSRTMDQPFEWDVQLSNTGKSQFGWATRDNSHLNVSLDGKITQI